MGWQNGGFVNGQPANVNQDGNRVEGLWGGIGGPDGQGHGHIVSNDGLNASYVREPGGQVIVDDQARFDPYHVHQNTDPRHLFPPKNWGR